MIDFITVINMFTEKIFLLLWIWLLLLIFLTAGSMIYWGLSQFRSSTRLSFIHKHLELSCQAPSKEDKQLRKFTMNYLRPDGLFILRMIAGHSGRTMCTEIIHELWARFLNTDAVPAGSEINKAFLVEESAKDFQPLFKSSKQFEILLDEASSTTELLANRPTLKATASNSSQTPLVTKEKMLDNCTQTSSENSNS